MLSKKAASLADRFVRLGAHTACDLATGDRVWLSLFDAREHARVRVRWDRCGALFELWHPCVAELVDYGVAGAATAFEAWRLPAGRRRWKARDAETAHAIASAVHFLHTHGLSAGRLRWSRIVERNGRPLLAPDEWMGLPLDGLTPRGGTSSESARRGEGARLRALIAPCAGDKGRQRPGDGAQLPENGPLAGRVFELQTPVARVLELLDCAEHGEPLQVHLCGPPGVDRTMALRMIARGARLHGYVPISTRCLVASAASGEATVPRGLVSWLRCRHVLIIDGETEPAEAFPDRGPRLLVELCTASARPHLLLSVHTSGPLERLHIDAAGLRPRAVRSSMSVAGAYPSGAREASPPYGPRALSDPPCALVPASQSRSDPLCRARARGTEGIELARRGRHAEGERWLREALGWLARRRDDGWAGLAALNLGRVLLWRGRVHDAAQAFMDARAHLDRAASPGASVRAAVFLGLAWTDTARLVDAEAVLRSACIAARDQADLRVQVFASLSLARCLLWQGRWDQAASALADAAAQLNTEGADGCDPPSPARVREGGRWVTAGPIEPGDGTGAGCPIHDLDVRVMEACLAARVALGRRDFPGAGVAVARALEEARRSGRSRDSAAAHTVAAALHGEIADVDGLRRHVAEGLRESSASHVPLQAVRLRLLLASGLRRAGRAGEGDRLAARLARIRRDHLPPLLRTAVEALARGEAAPHLGQLIPPADVSAARPAGTLPPPAAPDASVRGNPELAADIVDLLGALDEAGDETALLERIAGVLRRQTRAASVAVFGMETGGVALLASAGCRPVAFEVSRRAGDSGLSLVVPASASGAEAAVPVRHAGAAIGALGCRWTVGAEVNRERVVALLSTAAALAAPEIRAALDRRACPVTVAAAEPDLLGSSPPMETLRAAIVRAAGAPFPVLIEGESGSGKELVARAVHRAGPRRDRKYCAINCAALTDELLEAELFGHTRGAFTGAVADRSGLFEEADGGTVVLDEVGELSPRAQAKLLRVLQEGEVRRVGENATRRVDVRVIAAANRPLEAEVAAGRFRRDLFYRLNVIHLSVPALRDRTEDIPLLAGHFWAQATTRTGSRATLAPATLAALARHDWPGNVRELQNAMAALAVAAPRRGSVGPANLPAAFTRLTDPLAGSTLDDARRAFETRYVRAALARAGGVKGRAARELGLSRQGLAKLLVRLKIETSEG